MKSRNKLRLYLALYARPKYPNTYHYALHLSPKRESGHPDTQESVKFHCKNILQCEDGVVSTPWTFCQETINADADSRILARVLIGKVQSADELKRRLASVPVVQDQPDFDCVEWVRLALEELRSSGAVNLPEWDEVRGTALEFVGKKKGEGRFEVGWKGDVSKVATYDMLIKKETVT